MITPDYLQLSKVISRNLRLSYTPVGCPHGRDNCCAAAIRPAVRGVMRERGVSRKARASMFCVLAANTQQPNASGSDFVVAANLRCERSCRAECQWRTGL